MARKKRNGYGRYGTRKIKHAWEMDSPLLGIGPGEVQPCLGAILEEERGR